MQLSKLFYSPRGYWKGESTVNQLHLKTKIDKPLVRLWLKKTSPLAIVFTASTLRAQTHDGESIVVKTQSNASNVRKTGVCRRP